MVSLLVMASATIHLGQRGGVGQILAFQISVAVGAGQGTVNGASEFLLIHEQRNRSTAAFGGQGLVAVASQAIVIGGRSSGGLDYERY